MSSPTSVFKCEYFHLFIRKTHGAENRILGTIRSLMVVSCMYTTQHLRGHVILIDSTSPNKCCVPPTWTRINCRRKINAENNSVCGAQNGCGCLGPAVITMREKINWARTTVAAWRTCLEVFDTFYRARRWWNWRTERSNKFVCRISRKIHQNTQPANYEIADT